MKKKLLLLLLVSFIIWNVYPYVDHAEETTTVSVDQNNDSSKLNKQIEDLQEEVKDLKEDKKFSTDSVSKEDLYQALLDREKDVSSSLYNITMFFVSFIALAVTIGLVYFGKLGRDLKEHQKKVDLVMNSKEFDRKMDHLEQKILELTGKERLANEKFLVRNIRDSLEKAEVIVNDIGNFMTGDAYTPKINKILENEKYGVYKEYLSELKREYQLSFDFAREQKGKGIKPHMDSYISILSHYMALEKRLEQTFIELEGIRKKIRESMASDENK